MRLGETGLLRLLGLREAGLERLLLLSTRKSSLLRLWLLLLLLLLLLELLLELRRNRGHRRRASLEALLRLKTLTKAGRLGLKSSTKAGRLRLLLWCRAREASVLLLQRRLTETRGLRSKRTRLLLPRLPTSHSE